MNLWEWIERILGMDTDKQKSDPALQVIASALTSIAQSFATIALNTNGITPAQTAAIQQITGDLKVSHDRLQAAINAATTGVESRTSVKS